MDKVKRKSKTCTNGSQPEVHVEENLLTTSSSNLLTTSSSNPSGTTSKTQLEISNIRSG